MCKMNTGFAVRNLNDFNQTTISTTHSTEIDITNIEFNNITPIDNNGSVDIGRNNIATCQKPNKIYYQSTVGILIAVPEWEAIITITILSIIIILTIIGNVLVILSVFTYKPLRIVQNFFIVSLAVADLTVAILVLPFNVAYSILGRWEFGIGLCKMWLTCDVLCCTSSILNLCAIALDRYWAITDPINYAQKRNVERVLILISAVWILSLIISSPPLIGWNDWPENFSNEFPCQLTSNQGYVIYSSLGSFYIPLFIMTIVYIEIYIATKRRLRQRAWNSRCDTIALKNGCKMNTNDEPDMEPNSISSETNEHDEHLSYSIASSKKKKLKISKKKNRNIIDEQDDEIGQCSSKQLVCTQKENTSVFPENSENVKQENKNNSKEQLNKKTMSTAIFSAAATASTTKYKNSPAVYQFIEEKQKISLSKERRAARTLGIIMGVFVVCWLPFFLMYVILPFCSTCCPTDKLINFVTWLGYINSGLNPVIYTIFNIDYRRAFKKLLGLKF